MRNVSGPLKGARLPATVILLALSPVSSVPTFCQPLTRPEALAVWNDQMRSDLAAATAVAEAKKCNIMDSRFPEAALLALQNDAALAAARYQLVEGDTVHTKMMEAIRDGEAKATASFCARLIANPDRTAHLKQAIAGLMQSLPDHY